MNKKHQRGFTLVETVIWMTIIGLIAIPFLQQLEYMKKAEKERERIAKISSISDALNKYALENGRLPLPANPELALTDPNAGRSVAADQIPRATGNGPGQCGTISAAHAVSKIICRPGTRDLADGDSVVTTNVNSNLTEMVLIGALPTAELGIELEDSLDYYSHKFTYAVSYVLAADWNPTTAAYDDGYADNNGVIGIRSSEVPNDPNVYAINTNIGAGGAAQYAVISHGENGFGAYGRDGGARIACPDVGATPLENENCDDDANFMVMTVGNINAAGNYIPNQQIVHSYNLGGDATYFDDNVSFASSIYGRFWTPKGPEVSSMTSGSVATSRVGINVPDPVPGAGAVFGPTSPQVDVRGNVRATEIRTPRICDYGQAECIGLNNIVGASATSVDYIRCGSRGLTDILVSGKASNGIARLATLGEECDEVTFIEISSDVATRLGGCGDKGAYGWDPATGALRCNP